MVQGKVLDFLTDQGLPLDIRNSEILLAKFPKGGQDVECTLLLGTYLELLINTVIGVLKAITESARRRTVQQALIPLP